MIQIRNGVFETNSSSTHSIVIPKKTDKTSQYIEFHIGEYGWENEKVCDTASYLYTAILCLDITKKEIDMMLGKLKAVLIENGIGFSFEKPVFDEDYYEGNYYYILKNGRIDHCGELREFVNVILDNEDMLLRYLFDGVVYTGNDNQEDIPDGCKIASDYTYVFDGSDDYKGKYVPNPYHDEENYDYFYKGN